MGKYIDERKAQGLIGKHFTRANTLPDSTLRDIVCILVKDNDDREEAYKELRGLIDNNTNLVYDQRKQVYRVK